MANIVSPLQSTRVRLLPCAMAAAFLFCAPSATLAQKPVSPKQFIQSLADDVVALIREEVGRSEVRRETLHHIFLTALDTKSIGRFVLGRYWRTIKPQQKAEYLRLFPAYVASIYAGQFNNYQGETFTALRSSPIGRSRFQVNAEIQTPKGAKFAVTFRVRRDGNSYRVLDVAVEGASLIVTKRDEFASVLRRKGMDVLLAHLRRQVGSSRSDSASSKSQRQFAAAGHAI